MTHLFIVYCLASQLIIVSVDIVFQLLIYLDIVFQLLIYLFIRLMMALSVSNNHEKLIMLLLVDQDNDRTVIKCNDTSKLSNIKIISLRDKSLKPTYTYIVTDLTSAVEAVKEYYKWITTITTNYFI